MEAVMFYMDPGKFDIWQVYKKDLAVDLKKFAAKENSLYHIRIVVPRGPGKDSEIKYWFDYLVYAPDCKFYYFGQYSDCYGPKRNISDQIESIKSMIAAGEEVEDCVKFSCEALEYLVNNFLPENTIS